MKDLDEQDFSREAAMTDLLFWMDFESYLLLHLNAWFFFLFFLFFFKLVGLTVILLLY